MEPSDSPAPAAAEATHEQVTEKPKQSADTSEPKASGIKPRPADREREKEERKEAAAKELKSRRTAADLAEELAEKRERRESGDEPKDDKPATSKDRDDKGKFAGKKDEPAPERKAPEAPKAEPKREPAADAELRASRAVQETRQARAEADQHKRAATEFHGELAKTKKQIEAWKANPLDFLDDHGYSLERVINEINEGKLKPRAARQQLPPELAEEFEALKADRQARIKEQETQRETVRRQRDEGVIKSYLQTNPDRFPFLAVTEWASGDVVRRAYESKAGDAEPIMIELEKDLEKHALSWLGNERTAKAMLKRNPGLRNQLMTVLGISDSNVASPAASNGAGKGSADGPRSLSSVPSGNTIPTSYKPTKEERKRQGALDLAEKRRREAREDD